MTVHSSYVDTTPRDAPSSWPLPDSYNDRRPHNHYETLVPEVEFFARFLFQMGRPGEATLDLASIMRRARVSCGLLADGRSPPL